MHCMCSGMPNSQFERIVHDDGDPNLKDYWRPQLIHSGLGYRYSRLFRNTSQVFTTNTSTLELFFCFSNIQCSLHDLTHKLYHLIWKTRILSPRQVRGEPGLLRLDPGTWKFFTLLTKGFTSLPQSRLGCTTGRRHKRLTEQADMVHEKKKTNKKKPGIRMTNMLKFLHTIAAMVIIYFDTGHSNTLAGQTHTAKPANA